MVEPEGRPSVLVGAKEDPFDSDEDDYDSECRCGRIYPETGSDARCIFGCCLIRCNRIFESVFLTVVALIAIAHYDFYQWDVQHFVRNRLGGLTAFLMIAIYLPWLAFMCIFCDREDHPEGARYIECGRFRRVSAVVALISIGVILTPPIGVSQETGKAADNIKRVYGHSSPGGKCTLTGFSIVEWAFSAASSPWGPYSGPWGDFEKSTFVYKSNLTKNEIERTCTSPDAREWQDFLSMDVYLPKTVAAEEGASDADRPLAPIIFYVHDSHLWDRYDKDHVLWSPAYFLDRGYAVVAPQYGYRCDGYSFKEMVGQLADAFNYLNRITYLGLDRSKVVVAGDGAGAQLAMMMAYTKSHFQDCPAEDGSSHCGIRGVVDLYGIKSPSSLHGEALEQLAFTDEDLLYFPQHYVPVFPAGSLIPSVSFHGSWDQQVQYGHTRAYHQTLYAKGQRNNMIIDVPTYGNKFEAGYHGAPARLHRFLLERILASDAWGMVNTTRQGATDVCATAL